MSLTYCFELPYTKNTLYKCKRNDLAVIDTYGSESLVKSAVNRGVLVYGYLNIGALEDGRHRFLDLQKS